MAQKFVDALSADSRNTEYGNSLRFKFILQRLLGIVLLSIDVMLLIRRNDLRQL